MIYRFKMIITTEELYQYTIDADSLEEAEEMALLGETDQEEHLESIGVINREFAE